jgi:hypothetical protein
VTGPTGPAGGLATITVEEGEAFLVSDAGQNVGIATCTTGAAIAGGVMNGNSESCVMVDSYWLNATQWAVTMGCPSGSGGGTMIPQVVCIA